jgi:hypothetical protein
MASAQQAFENANPPPADLIQRHAVTVGNKRAVGLLLLLARNAPDVLASAKWHAVHEALLRDPDAPLESEPNNEAHSDEAA